jgi:hypothetical protein
MTIKGLPADLPGSNGNAGLGDDYIKDINNSLLVCFGEIDGPVEKGVGKGLASHTDISALFDRMDAVEATQASTRGFDYGSIIYWSGGYSTWPSGWYICDGNQTPSLGSPGQVAGKSVPNLLDRFIISAGNTISPGAEGGGTETLPAGAIAGGTTDAFALTPNEIPNLDGRIEIDINTGNDGINHQNTSQVAGGNNPAGQETLRTTPFRFNGLNGAGHSHGLSAVADHTHTQVNPLYHGLIPIIYMGEVP